MVVSSQCKFVPGRFVPGCFVPLQVRPTASSSMDVSSHIYKNIYNIFVTFMAAYIYMYKVKKSYENVSIFKQSLSICSDCRIKHNSVPWL